MQKDFTLFKERRQTLKKMIKDKYPNKNGMVLLFAGFEEEKYRFRQESSFYYFTGLEEPAVALAIDLEGPTSLYIPSYGDLRTKWVESEVYGATSQTLAKWGIDELKDLGKPCKSYQFSCLFSASEYENLVSLVKKHAAQKNSIYTLNPEQNYTQQRLLIERLQSFAPELREHIVDILPLVARMRRVKSQAEVEILYKAIDCTMAAQEAAASIIEQGVAEYEVQAGIEFIFTQSQAQRAFPSIVASGANATTLHYSKNSGTLKNGDLCLVDIGAEIDYYCGDLTRVYPVSGTFTKRQRELYNLVLECQAHIELLAKPGLWISNKDKPQESLHHLAMAFFESKGYGAYFTHGIGHFLGMDVHDVGNTLDPLQEGDVITIEPGLYIPEEKIGIRIEDNYWLVKDGNVCLSQQLPKESHLIEELMAQEMDDYEAEDYE